MINSSKRKVGYLLIALAIILLILFVVLFLSPDKNPFRTLIDKITNKTEKIEKTPEEEFNEMIQQKKDSIVYTFDEEAENNRDWSQDDFKQLSRSFAERFGSYSNQSNYGNIEDLEIFMSAKMKKWAQEYVADLRANTQYSGSFYGIVTKALVEPEISDFALDSGQVDVLVPTQREENSSDGEPRVFNQDVKISFIKVGGEWLVDSAIWQ
ncbi:MAG TPA: hypothetical protein PK142_01535 [bacterium]|nr:hypothetical protein [bacterium]